MDDSMLKTVLVWWVAFSAVVNFVELYYRIFTEKDKVVSWKIRAVACLAGFLVCVGFLVWMKLVGWW